ncbi:MAG TPA: beta-ketoacyl synthase chain length factor [Rhodanobacteraceae bacterium]|nr:beta-ketoacyl synthase chain length factor [Rhodanobacteraceae bacterium]
MSIDVVIEGVGLWSPALPGWQASRDILAGKAEPVAASGARPAASLLAPGERRRAPDSVLLALEVAQQAAQMAAREGRTLRGVFASDHGDLAINDYLCATLLHAPEQLSPTKFHNSVHNAAAGYWAIATGSMASTTALSAGDCTFAAGLFEAALLARSEDAPVLFVACDLPAAGPLADVVSCRVPFAVGLVLSPQRDRGGAALRLAARGRSAPVTTLAPEPALLHAVHGDNPVARSLPLLAALARGEGQAFTLQAGPRLHLQLEISPWLN